MSCTIGLRGTCTAPARPTTTTRKVPTTITTTTPTIPTTTRPCPTRLRRRATKHRTQHPTPTRRARRRIGTDQNAWMATVATRWDSCRVLYVHHSPGLYADAGQ